MLELTRLLGEYQEGIVLIGGWVPELLLSGAGHRHTGSLDVDLALDHHALGDTGYKTILQLLLARGYRQGEQPFIFFRTVPVENITIEVEVDFLAGEYAGTSRSHRTQNVQEMKKIPAIFLAGISYAYESKTYSSFPVARAILSSPMALVIWISRGQARVQLKTVWQR
jgi:hypothetical protein